MGGLVELSEGHQLRIIPYTSSLCRVEKWTHHQPLASEASSVFDISFGVATYRRDETMKANDNTVGTELNSPETEGERFCPYNLVSFFPFGVFYPLPDLSILEGNNTNTRDNLPS